MLCVLIVEPWTPGEPPLTVEEQVNEVVGPFKNEQAATEWIDWFTSGNENHPYRFYIKAATSPEDVFRKVA